MKTKRWHKWLVGLVSFISFTGLFTVIDGKIIAKKQNVFNKNAKQNSSNNVVKGPNGDIISLFIHNKQKMTEIDSLSSNEKQLRGKKLAELNWNENLSQYQTQLQPQPRSDRRTSRS